MTRRQHGQHLFNMAVFRLDSRGTFLATLWQWLVEVCRKMFDGRKKTNVKFFICCRTHGHCIHLKTMVIMCMMCSGHQSTRHYSRPWMAQGDWTYGTLTMIQRCKSPSRLFDCIIKMTFLFTFYTHVCSFCRCQQRTRIPSQWRHLTVCVGRILVTRSLWAMMMVTCLFMMLAR